MRLSTPPSRRGIRTHEQYIARAIDPTTLTQAPKIDEREGTA